MLHTPNKVAQFPIPGNANAAQPYITPSGYVAPTAAGTQQRTKGRPRAVSNISDSRYKETSGGGYVPSSSHGISQWQTGVQTAQEQPGVYPSGYLEHPPPAIPGGGNGRMMQDAPDDPGPPPNFEGLRMSNKDKKAVVERWERQKTAYDEWHAQFAQQTKPSRKQSHSRSRYGEPTINGTAFPSGYRHGQYSNPSSDVERAFNHLSLNPTSDQARPGATAAQQRHAERGRRLSGGALGLSGSAAAQRERENEAIQAAQRLLQQDRSRSRPPQGFEQDIRPAYMPSRGSGNPLLADSQQPGVIPRGYTAAQPQQPQNMGRVSNISQIGGHSPTDNPYTIQPSPQPSPAMYAQAMPADAPGMVPVNLNGTMTMAYPVGHVSQHPELFAGMQLAPDASPLPSPLLQGGMAPYVTTSPFVDQPVRPEQPRKKSNINDVISREQDRHHPMSTYGPPPAVDKTFITPGPPPKQLTKVNITSYTQPAQQQTQPVGRPRAVSQSQSSYVLPATMQQPLSQQSITNPYASTIDPLPPGVPAERGIAANGRPPSHLPAQRPPLLHQETNLNGESQPAGPVAFGNRPAHARQSSYQAAIKQPAQTNTPDSATDLGRGESIPVSLRRPNSRMQVRPFMPTVIAYDLNSEHRAQEPLKFGRFVYDRDVSHEEWGIFTNQILACWKERDPGYNRYHSTVRRINSILSAWNYAFFNPRGMDVVLFKGNERRSGNRFGQPESEIDFLEEAGPVSDREGSEGSESEDEEEDAATRYILQKDPTYKERMEKEKAAMNAYRKEERRREAAMRPLEAPHSLVIYDLCRPVEPTR